MRLRYHEPLSLILIQPCISSYETPTSHEPANGAETHDAGTSYRFPNCKIPSGRSIHRSSMKSSLVVPHVMVSTIEYPSGKWRAPTYPRRYKSTFSVYMPSLFLLSPICIVVYARSSLHFATLTVTTNYAPYLTSTFIDGSTYHTLLKTKKPSLGVVCGVWCCRCRINIGL